MMFHLGTINLYYIRREMGGGERERGGNANFWMRAVQLLKHQFNYIYCEQQQIHRSLQLSQILLLSKIAKYTNERQQNNSISASFSICDLSCLVVPF